VRLQGDTCGALMTLHAAIPHASRGAEMAVLVAANLAATMSRFVLYRGWVFSKSLPPERNVPSVTTISSTGSAR
jgi:hypothetical protein